jgi:multidrug efflux system membrane fusion protein
MSPRARSLTVRIVIGVVVIGVLAAWLRSRGTAAERGGSAGSSAAADARVVPVKLAAAATQDVPMWLEGLGTVAAAQQVTVRAQVDGRLDKVVFTEGQAVKQGDLLAQIDPRPFQVQLHQAQGALARDQAQRKNAQTTFERNQSLRAQNLISQQQVDDAAAQLGQAEGLIAIDRAAVENAQLQLDYAQIKAPIDGVTGVRQVDAGNVIHASDPAGLVVVTQLEPAAVLFSVPQDQLPAIARAMAAGEVPVEAWSRDGRTRIGVGKAAVIDNQINQATSTLRVKALIPNPGHALWPNQFVKARMLLETIRGALVVPTVAVQRGPQGTFVYVVGPDRTAKLQPIEVGATAGELTIVTKGLAPGAQVVVEGANQLRPGGKVEVAGEGGGDKADVKAGDRAKGKGRRP